MWRLMNWLFGWDYVHIQFSSHEAVARVKYTQLGRAYVNWCSTFIWLDGPEHWKITPLTVSKQKAQHAKGDA